MNRIKRAGLSLGAATAVSMTVTAFGAELARETDNSFCSVDPNLVDFNGGHCGENFAQRMDDDLTHYWVPTLGIFALASFVVAYASRPTKPEENVWEPQMNSTESLQ